MPWMPWWAWVLGGYCGPMIACFRWVWRAVWEDCPNDPPEWADLPIGCLMTLVLLAFWPITLLVAEVEPATLVRVIGGESRAQKQARRERELREREQAVRQAERDLGIGQD